MPASASTSPPPLSIVPATGADIAIVRDLAHRIWPVAYDGVLTRGQIDNMLLLIYSQENLAEEMRQGHVFWLAHRDGAPVGFASAYREESSIWIKKLYVEPRLHGQGIGQALLREAIRALSPAADVKLLVNPNNISAQRFYEHVGFILWGKKSVKMGDHHFTDLIYMRPLLG